jgi:hemerythrin-like domain-containing protein
MTRRHDALIPLTHDHHHALAQARSLQKASTSSDAAERRKAAGEFVNFYLGRAVRHFHEEEELFFPPLIDHGEGRDLVLRAVAEHLRLHGLVTSLKHQLSSGEIDPRLLGDISALLPAHVRFEEQELFPLIESVVSSRDLNDLATFGRRDV